MLHQQFLGDTLVVINPLDSSWYLMNVKFPMLKFPKFHRQFRRRFRRSYAQFIQFVSDAREGN